MPNILAAKRANNKEDDSLKDKLKEFRKIIRERKKFECPMNDDFLTVFLRARKFNLEQAFTRLENFFSVKKTIFKDGNVQFLPAAHSEFIEEECINVLKTVDNQGVPILLIKNDKWDMSRHDFNDLLGITFLIMFEAIRTSTEMQMKGVTILFDLSGFGFAHLAEFRISRCNTIVKFAQNAFPARINGIYFINNPGIFNLMYAMAKPFLSQKMKRRIIFHGYDLASLHKVIDPKMLPNELGGQKSFDEIINKDLIIKLLSNDEFYRELDSYNSK